MEIEYVQFVGALIFFVGILVGSYWFVYVPGRGSSSDEDDSNKAEG